MSDNRKSGNQAPFIVFEGGEGSGKSSQSKRLAAQLAAAGTAIVHTRDPGGCPSAGEIRSLLVTGEPNRWTPAADILLYTAARAELIEHVIWPALSAGKTLISDRFIDSTLAYQANGDLDKEKVVMDLHGKFCRNLIPDLTIILDIDPEIGLARSNRRLAQEGSNESRFETMEIDFHRRLRAVFLSLAAREPSRYLVIDATRSQDEIFAEILATMNQHFPDLVNGRIAA